MSLDHNGRECHHVVTEIDKATGEEYCVECGDTIEPEEEDNAV